MTNPLSVSIFNWRDTGSRFEPIKLARYVIVRLKLIFVPFLQSLPKSRDSFHSLEYDCEELLSDYGAFADELYSTLESDLNTKMLLDLIDTCKPR